MLKFFKKQGSKQQDSTDLTINSLMPETNYYERCRSNTQQTQCSTLSSFEDEGLFDIDEFQNREQSRLSKTLNEVLNDKSALSYFIQFMEARNALPYLRSWLDIENFQSAIQQFDVYKKSSLDTRSFSTKIEHDSLSVSTDCDSLTADSSSLNDYSNMTISEYKSEKTFINKVQGLSERISPTCDRYSENSPKCNGSSNNLPVNGNHLQIQKYMQEFTDDALGIFKKYIALEAPEFINCSDDIRNEIIENICTYDKVLSSDCFKNAQMFVFSVMDKEYFDAFLQSDYFCKHQIDVLTSGNVVLEDILYNETALFYFMEFLEQENNRYLLEFWLAASNFHQQLRDQKEFLDPIEAQNDAVILYDKYFSLQALCPLGFGDRVRFAVEQNICGENGLMQDCFNLPLKMIEQVLERNYLKSFLASQLFYKYLSELINTVQSSGYCIYDRNRVHSDCSSEKSFFSTNNTFLAMEVPKKKRNDKAEGSDMNIDTRQLYDPDALWKRKKHHRLSFGRVTQLGQFVTDFEPEPDKKNSSKIRNVVKRFVNLEEDKKKEELAWQVAEMIVKSITSVTLTDSEQNEQKS